MPRNPFSLLPMLNSSSHEKSATELVMEWLPRGLSNPPPPFSWAISSSPDPSSPDPPGFKWISGRGFKTGGSPVYAMPNDMEEVSRLNAQHYQIRFASQGNYQAPVSDMLRRGCRVLDAGCGTGIWSIELACQYPASQFVGTDPVDVFEESANGAPRNCTFQIADTRALPFEDGSFDYVFQRLALLVFREDEWPGVIAELVRVTRPGGWIELVDIEGFLRNPGPYTEIMHEKVQVFFKMRDINTSITEKFGDMLVSAGVEDVHKSVFSVPMGWGPAEVGIPSAINIENVWKSIKPQMLLSLGLRDEEYDDIATEAVNEFTANKTYWNAMTVYGRKSRSDGAA